MQEVASDDKDIVSALQSALAELIGEDRFELWFGAGAHLRVSGDDLTVAVPSEFVHQWLRTHFRSEIEAACRQVAGRPMRVEFHVDPQLTAPVRVETESETTDASETADDAPTSPAPRTQAALTTSRRKFARLNDFVVGACNKLALTAAEMAAQQPGSFSPLMIHGPTGTGKTHLLEGVWGAVKRARPGIRAVYLSAEQFTSYFLEALRGSGLPNFRRKYRGVELLIIDDVHFLQGKRATLVEFQHTIDTLLRQQRQLVFAADRPPEQLEGLGEELRSRLSAGLVCPIEPPDFRTRQALLQQFAGRLDIEVSDEVRRYIASGLTNHARELVGALNRLKAYSQALERPVTMSLAEQALGEMIRSSTRPVTLPQIEKTVCETFGLGPRLLRSDRKSKAVSYPRMLAMWLARKYTRAALSEIGEHFGRRSHSTVISAQKRVDTWMAAGDAIQLGDRDWPVEEAIRQIESRLRAG